MLGDGTRVPPPRLRILEATHLATALDLGDSLHIMLKYDKPLVEAARLGPGGGIPRHDILTA
ncbi:MULTISPECIES: hypothetical protein [unclassified Frankia]|uniref:hypothetical protein n=1 Tax=unclassified Frankia TaxID=2632575 RepID=UPI002AD382BA|nr:MULTISPECIES: hypothetical protein [unclassified Frankia]